MSADAGSTAVDHAFWLLSDPMRIDILRTVWAADAEQVSFSEIRAGVGKPDGGRFNYHIDKLQGHFLVKGDDGYRLTQSGIEVIRAVLAGTMTQNPEFEAGPIDGSCPECGGPLWASYDEYGSIDCRDCGATVMWNEFPPAGLEERDGSVFAYAFDRWVQHRFRLALDGVCPNCAREMESGGIDGSERAAGFSSLHRCPHCRYEARVPLFGIVVQHPAVISCYYDSGIDVTSMPFWDLQELQRSVSETELSSEPRRIRVTIAHDGRELSLTVDDTLAITDIDLSER